MLTNALKKSSGAEPPAASIGSAALVCIALAMGISNAMPQRALAQPQAADSAQQRALDQALERYRQLALRTDHRGLAQLFTEDARLSHGQEAGQQGRAQILRFLASFEGVQVKRYEMQTESTRIDAARARQQGRWQQTVLLPQGQVLDVGGRFEIDWRRGEDGGWLIERLHTEN